MALRIIFALSSFALLYSMLAITATNELKNSKETTRLSANAIGTKLDEIMKKVTKYDVLQENYKPGAYDINQRNGTKLVDEMKKELEKILQNKIQSIVNLAIEAERLHSNYTWETDIKFEFLDSKFLNDNPSHNITLEKEVSFSNKVEVNLDNSTVHVPTDVYKGSDLILNTAKWSKGLDGTFTKNRHQEPSLLWQYFGSYTGVYRFYPGYKWRTSNADDFFDHRRRGWYIQGSSSPKNMVILLDLSGSMIGSKLAISKLSAMMLLDTLQENDFVNIVIYNSKAFILCEDKNVIKGLKAKYPNTQVNCSSALLQATKQNKQYLTEMVNFVKANDTANVSAGFKLAVEVLKDAHKSNNQSSSGCIKTINFFTDGVEANEHKKTLKVLEEAGTKEAQIRIFGYLVGREKGSPYLPVQDFACKYRGYFYTVETLSDVRENVTSYLNVLSRPLALQRFLANDYTPTWTPLYLDQLPYLNVMGRPQGLQASHHPVSWTPIYLDEGVLSRCLLLERLLLTLRDKGLGLMITVVAPVYDREKRDRLLGVVATDVALPQLKAAIPEAKVGVNGYGFAVNNNGFIVIHPYLKDDSDYSDDRSSKRDKRSATNLLLQDVNLEEPKENLDNLSGNLIDKKTGSMFFKMRILSKNKKRVSAKHTYHFSYTDINGTSFSSAIAMTDRGRNYFDDIKFVDGNKIKLTWKKRLNNLKPRNNETVMVAPWNICPGVVPRKRSTTPLYQPVYADAEDLLANLTDIDENLITKLCGGDSYRVLLNQLLYGAQMTNNLDWNIDVNDTNGYLAVFVGTNGGFSRVRAPGGESPIGSDVTVEPFYQQAAEFDELKGTLVVTAAADKNDDSVVTSSTPIYVEKNNKKVLAAVIAMQMKGDTLQEVLLNSSEICKDNDDKWSCYLIDEDAYIVTANKNKTLGVVGKSFGEVHGEVFAKMVKDGLYTKIVYKDTNFKCPSAGGSSSNAMRLMNPLLAVSSYVIWMTQTLFWSLVQFNIYSFFSAKSQVFAASSDESFCTAEIDYYKAIPMKTAYANTDGRCSKDSCVGEYYIAEVEKTNLRLVVLENCCSKEKKLLAKPPYFVLPPRNYRKLPQLKCYAYSSEESKECGSGCNLSPTKLLIALLMLVYPFLAHS